MATWQGTNGGLLAGIGGVNSNAPSVNDIGNTLQLIRQNNDIERSGANNVGLTALQGLSGIAGVFQQEKQAQRQKEFQQAYANAYASGDRGALRQLATQYPDQIESVRKGMGFIDEEQRNSIGTLAAGARLASSSPEAMQSWLQNNAKELTRVGVDPNSVAQMYQQNPSGFGEFVDHLGMAALGPIDYFNVQDKMVGRQLEKGRLDESIRQADMENARGWANIQNAQLDRAQRAQMHSDEMGLKLMELGQKGKPSADLIKGLNSDITNFGKNYNSVRAAANSLQALSKVNTGAAQLGIIFNYMKSLDPQSVVREGEQVQVMRSDGIWGQIKGYVDQLNAGNGLSQEARDNIVNAAKINANAMGQQFNQQVDEYLDTYGDTIPQGLKKSLGRRKAKLFDDVPAQPTPQGGNGQTKAAPSGISEGATATNPKTGQKLIYRNGQWQPM
ncbi:TPA: phage DNA ejection protein [Escherichia coli]|uniref:phage DNA ejection protein n=1 Tax=Escherichia coli TaxID=562 RepID=UPI0017766605|nr:phage DNA ejection protein [Escherichia coli]MBE1148290.1 phage DNA ejection protein [Escherichia coli]HAH6836252.1 acyltransferase [Escherichia coli]HBE3045068.1 phage DNA ejection protein [Escherichia coli]HBL0995115.1 phage DNA ejection protein [Escherichia coli]HCN0447725.1 phage DNA ejection protein [Escherichia coli]